MNNRYFRAALLATAATQLFVGSQAFAQSTESVPAATSAEAPSDDVIIVTARRVEERLQDVPISITVVDQDRLTKSNITSSDDLVRVVPGLNVQSRYSSEQANFSIRGFSQELRTSASVGTYFAEVVAPRGGGVSLQGGDGAGPGKLFDLQNVQVLKGPQGTLFGRNTTGGAVLLSPRKPTSEFEGYVEGSYGNYDMRRLQGVINLPIADWARLRLGADYQKRDGYIHNVSGIGPRDFADVDYYALRASLVLDLADDLENYTILSYSNSDNNGSPPQLFRANSAAGFGGLAVAQVDRLNASDDKYQIEQKLINPRSLTKQFQVINITTLTAIDSLTIKNIASYSTLRQGLRQDIFSTNFLLPTVPQGYISTAFSFNPDGSYTNDQNNFTEELQFQGVTADSKLNYQVGLYYEHSTPGDEIVSLTPAVGTFCQVSGFTSVADIRCMPPGLATGGGSLNQTSGTIEFINMAAYAQATYALTDQLKLTGGLRYTYDRSRGRGTGQNYRFVSTTPGTYGTAVANGCISTYNAFPNCTFIGKTSSKRPTWTVNLSYNPTEDTMIYGTYSRGYRQGAVAPFAAGGNETFGPEKVDNYEIGTKLSFNGPVRGNLNFAGFYSDLTNQQLQVGLQNTTTGNTATSIFNAGASRIYGVEFDGMLRFSSLFRVNGSATYLNTKLKSIVLPTSFPGFDVVLPSALAGDPLPFSPKWGLNFGGTFTVPTDESLGKIELSAVYRYNSPSQTAASSSTTIKTTKVSQLDLNADWRNVGGQPLDLSLFATNVTNQFTATFIQPLFNSFGFDTRSLGKPRMYGVRARVRFGAGS